MNGAVNGAANGGVVGAGKAHAPGARLLPLALACFALHVADTAVAAEWSAEGGLQTRLRYNEDRPDAEGQATLRTREGRVSGSMNLARSHEAASTRLDLLLDLPVAGLNAGRNVQGRVALAQTLATLLDSFSGGLDASVDDNRDNTLSAIGELIGRRRRTAVAGNVSWQHQFSERFSTQTSFNGTQTRFGSGTAAAAAAAAEDFRERQWAASASYRWDELLRLSLQAQHSRYALDNDDGASTTDSVSLQASRALSENSSMSASLGAYRSRRTATLRGFACPLPVQFCQAGIVAPVPVQERVQTPSSGSQYSLSYQGSLSERTALALTAGRQLSGTGTGLVVAESASVSLNHAVTPQLSWSLVGSHSRSTTPGAISQPEPRVNGLEAGFTWLLAERLSVGANLSARRFREPQARTAFTSTQISITLQYQGPRIVAAR